MSREFRTCNDHAWNITLVMKWSQAAKTELLTAISQRKQRHIRQTARTTCPPPAPPAARNRTARKSAAQHRPRATPRAARPRAVHVRSVPPGTRSADDCPRGNIDDAHPPLGLRGLKEERPVARSVIDIASVDRRFKRSGVDDYRTSCQGGGGFFHARTLCRAAASLRQKPRQHPRIGAPQALTGAQTRIHRSRLSRLRDLRGRRLREPCGSCAGIR